MATQDTGGQLHYWRTPSGSEVDFVWTRGPHAVGVEVKAAATWRTEYGAPLKALIAQGNLQTGYGVYLGTAELKDGPLRVFPLKRFLKELATGHILVAANGRRR
jgi:predicted AAA+ superfamily ATPase